MLLALCEGNPWVTGGFPSQRWVTRSFDVFFDLRLIKWKHFPRCWVFVRGIHRSPLNSPHKGQWRRALMFSLICDWPTGVNSLDAGDLRCHRAHYDLTVMSVHHWHGVTGQHSVNSFLLTTCLTEMLHILTKIMQCNIAQSSPVITRLNFEKKTYIKIEL